MDRLALLELATRHGVRLNHRQRQEVAAFLRRIEDHLVDVLCEETDEKTEIMLADCLKMAILFR